MKNVLAGKTVLVTGGTGSIGSEIVRQALDQDTSQVIAFSRDEIKHFLIRKTISDDRFQTMVGDVSDLCSVERVFDRFDIDIVYHAAAMKHVTICEEFPVEAAKINVLGTQNVVDLGRKHGIAKLITISTDKAAYPVNVMGACKFIAERITLNANKMSRGEQLFSCVRFGNVANSRGSVIPVYVDNLLNHEPIQVTSLEVTRFIMDIPDAVKLIIKATKYAQGGEIFILKMRAFKLGDLIDVMVERVAPRLAVSPESVQVRVTGLELGEKLHETLVNENESLRIYELDDMYVVLPDNGSHGKYSPGTKVSLSSYMSSDVERLSKDEIEEIVVKYLKSRSPGLYL